MRTLALPLAALCLIGCKKHEAAPTAAATPPATAPAPKPADKPAEQQEPPPPPPDPALAHGYTTSTIALPGGGEHGVFMDYLMYDPRTKTVWVPAGNTGAVDVIDTATGKVAQVTGFATKEVERRGHKLVVGPSAATLGETGVYIGNRGDSSVCEVDDAKLAKGTCGTLDSSPDGLAYVARTNEVWVTTPRDKSIRILDGKTLAQKARLTFDGEPEGFAVDPVRGRFYTNLEDKNETLAIDLASHQTVATWQPRCDEHGPHGLRLDAKAGFLFIACSAKIETMDVGHAGLILGSLDTGAGVDDLDYDAVKHQLAAGASRAGSLTIATVDAKGALASAAVVATAQGARNGVFDGTGKVYLSHGKGSELIVASPPAPPAH